MLMNVGPVKLFYFYSYSFADPISPELVTRIVDTPIQATNGYEGKRGARRHLLGLGSIFHQARTGDIIWGSGVNPYWQRQRELPSGFEIDIRAVRGPLTRAFLMDELGLDCPEVYGDPALLLPRYFPECQVSPVREYVVIPQHNDEEFIRRNWTRFSACNVFLCQRPNRMPWRQVVGEILTSRFVIASSLHALIIAEAYGIPARWWHTEELPSSQTEGRFKFNDYYASTGRSLDDFASSIEEALEMRGKEPIHKFDLDKLDNAFPHELFRGPLRSILGSSHLQGWRWRFLRRILEST